MLTEIIWHQTYLCSFTCVKIMSSVYTDIVIAV